jgi:hypothetical protein
MSNRLFTHMRALALAPLFAGCTPGELERVQDCSTVVELGPGRVLWDAGECAGGCCGGLARDGQGILARERIETISRTTLLVLDLREFATLRAELPHVAQRVTAAAGSRQGTVSESSRAPVAGVLAS